MEALKIIPELFYDLFGRVIPGCITLWVCVYALGFDLNTIINVLYGPGALLANSEFAVISSLLLIAYLIGHIISPLSNYMHSNVLQRFFPASFRVLQDIIIDEQSSYPIPIRNFYKNEALLHFGDRATSMRPEAYRRLTYIMYDTVRLLNPTAGTRIAKMRAEYRMLEGMYVGTIVAVTISIVNNLLNLFGQNRSWNFTLVLILALLAAGISAARLFKTFQWAVINQYYEINEYHLTDEKEITSSN